MPAAVQPGCPVCTGHFNRHQQVSLIVTAYNGVASLDASGRVPDAQIPDAITRDTELTAGLATKADTTALTSHTGNTSNPHGVTAVQVGNTTAQWNANQLQGRNVANTAPTDGQVLTYSTANTRWEPATPSAGGGGGGNIIVSSTAPSSPTINTLWFETTVGMLWFWDGTYWLSTTEVNRFENLSGQSTTTSRLTLAVGESNNYNIYLTKLEASYNTFGVNGDASNHWKIYLQSWTGSATTLVGPTLLSHQPTQLNSDWRYVVATTNIPHLIDTVTLGTNGLFFRAEKVGTIDPITAAVTIRFRWARR